MAAITINFLCLSACLLAVSLPGLLVIGWGLCLGRNYTQGLRVLYIVVALSSLLFLAADTSLWLYGLSPKPDYPGAYWVLAFLAAVNIGSFFVPRLIVKLYGERRFTQHFNNAAAWGIVLYWVSDLSLIMGVGIAFSGASGWN